MATTGFSVHKVESITVETKQFPAFFSVDITFISADGSVAIVTAYCDKPVAIVSATEPKVITEEMVAA